MKKYTSKLAVLMALVLLTGCGSKAPAETGAETAAAETAAATQPSVANGMEFAPVEEVGVALVTPYITLYCPEEWQETVKVDKQETETGLTLTFHTPMGEGNVVLFSLIFSKADTAEGFLLGSLTDAADGPVYVFAAMNETVPEGLSGEEATRFGSMQERVNDLIMQLHEAPGFESGRQ